MTKNDVIELLGISRLDNILINNILQLNNLRPNIMGNFDVEKSCSVYADAAQLYRMYLPDYVAAKLLNTCICDLIEMNIECIPTPVEYQSIFYDSYKEGTFRYSKYLFRTSDVLIIFQTYSKELFLEMLPEITELYPEKFFTLEDTGRILGMSRIKSEMYHFYFMELNIRFAYFDGIRKYFLDDINKVIDYAQEFFDDNFSNYELTQKYSYACYSFMQNGRIKEKSNIENIYYDVVLSDYRFPNGFQQSYDFYPKKCVEEAYHSWFANYNRIICSVKNPSEYDGNLYKEVLIDTNMNDLMDKDGIIGELYDISRIYNNQDIFFTDEYNEMADYYAYKNTSVNNNLIYFIFGIEEEDQEQFKHSISRIIGRKSIYDFIYIIQNLFDIYRKYMFEAMYNKYSKISLKNKKQIYYNIFEKSKCFIQLNVKEERNKTIVPYEWCKNIYYFKPNDLNKNNFISYNDLRKLSLEWYYSSGIMEKKGDTYYGIVTISNQTFSNKVFEFYNNQVKSIFHILRSKTDKPYSVTYQALSKLIVLNDLPSDCRLFTLYDTMKYMGTEHYPFTLIWLILWNCGLTIIFYNYRFYFYIDEIVNLQKEIQHFTNNQLSFNQIYDITHGKIGYIDAEYEVNVINWAYAYLISKENPCFVYYDGLSELYLENSFNYPYSCELFLTNAELQGNLQLLPRMLPWTLTNILLHIDNNDSSINKYKYYNKNKVFMMIEQLNEFKENYVPKDKIIEFLKLDINYFTKNDLKILDTIQPITIPWSVKYSRDWYDAESKSDYAYRKADLYSICDYFHNEQKNTIDFGHIYYLDCEYGNNWYETYKMRLEDFISRSGLNFNKEFYPIWDEFIKIRLLTENGSQKTIDNHILQYIRTCYTIFFLLEEKKLDSIRLLTTNDINGLFDRRIPVAYCRVLQSFFRYATNFYNSRLELVSYRVKELKIPKRKNHSASNILPEIYSFEEYSQVFDYCNNYQRHITKAVKEIQKYGTCKYASTWFYVMSHLNNTWRSSDFTYFPNINIEKVMDRNIKEERYLWFINNNLSKSEAIILALELQNNPKIISKTKKYTVFMCSDELLQTYMTVYMLLSYYTSFLSYDREFICHFKNQYNCLDKRLLSDFFAEMQLPSFEFKSRKMNKTLATMIDFLEEYYIGNDYDQMRREAMILRSHVNPESTFHYIKKNREVFERLTNMLCARGEFGFVYEYLLNAATKKEVPANIEEKTDKIREIHSYIPDIADAESIFSFMNFTKKEKSSFMKYINTLSLQELQGKISELYLRKNPSKMSIRMPCINYNCPDFTTTDSSKCSSCIFHIPTVYSLVTVCKSLKDDIQEYSSLIKENKISITIKNRLMRGILKKSTDIITAKNVFGDEILEEIFEISGLYYESFMDLIQKFYGNAQILIEQREGESNG